MTVTPPDVPRRAAVRNVWVAWPVGVLIAACLGAGATLVRPEQFWLVFGVFTACFLAPCLALSWLLIGGGRLVTRDPLEKDNVESRWVDKAASGALFDLVPAVGISAGAVSFLGLQLPADTALLGVVAFALTDGALRYAVLRRRES
jgi:hypothetical protein